MIFAKTYDNPYDAWKTITSYFLSLSPTVLHEGEYLTHDGVIVSEILHPTTEIKPNHKYTQDFADAYVKQIVEGNSDGDFVYTYHERLFDYLGTNQIEYCINELKRDSHSRRAVAITWQPEKDSKLEDVPCLNWIKFVVNGNKLDLYCIFRSNDMFLAFYQNALGLSGLLIHVAKQLNLEVGKLTISSYSAHVYIKRDLNDMRRLLA